jgi:single-strand selective monofunctional uracil DNA glycosylase
VDRAELLLEAADTLSRRLSRLRFAAPVSYVYNPLVYAREPYACYLRRYADNRKHAVFLGMNPGPFGMAQTGVPFGDVTQVRDWLGIEAPVERPKREHPRRPIQGFDCRRSEVSGSRLWGLFRARCGSASSFFAWGFVTNYCPLVFMEDSGRNLTPDKLPPGERVALFAPCDAYLLRVLELLTPRWLIGVGRFATMRAQAMLSAHASLGHDVRLATIPHPSPASPAANRDWAASALRTLEEQGVLEDSLATTGSLG